MNLFGSKNTITVEIKVMGFLGGEYLSVVTEAAIPEGSGVKRLLKELVDLKRLGKSAYNALKSLKPPITVMINGESPKNGKSAILNQGDSVSVFTPISGG